MRIVSLRPFAGRSRPVSQPVWQYPVQGYCPEDGRYYAVRANPLPEPRRGMTLPMIFAAAIYLFNPTTVAFQDMASLVAASDQGENRWTAFMVQAPAGSVHQAEMPFVDATMITGSTTAAGIDVAGIGRVALGGGHKGGKLGVDDPNPDEDRVNRTQKEGRIVSVMPKAPARAFNAGSLLEQTSMLLRPVEKPEVRMAFETSDIRGKEIGITMAFHRIAPPRAIAAVPAMLASLVTNDKPDILALGYAPATPDYATTSPFESILTPDPDSGRFVPPIGAKDHPWAATPLPPSAFSSAEQKCLAEAVYYEARGEAVKGQVAVAQVVLNRVRNPAYPSTICGVVYQNRNWLNACQFSFACDGQKHRVTESSHWRMAQQVAKTVSAGQIWLPEVGSSTHYHAVYVNPRWGGTMHKMAKIGLHIFYRTYGGGWS